MVGATVINPAVVDAAFGGTTAQAKPPDADPFRKGDFVVYPAHGVGRVDRVGTEEVAGHRLNLIQISFAENRMTVRIPVVKARVAGLRKLARPEILADALMTLQGRPRASRLIWARRAQAYQSKINSGDPRALAEVARDLQTASDGSSPRNLFELAIERLAAEFAAVFNTDKAAAVGRLMQVLQQARASTLVRPAVVQQAAAPDSRKDLLASAGHVRQGSGDFEWN